MKSFSRWMINWAASVSLMLAIFMTAAWASRLLPRQFRIPVYLSFVKTPQREVFISASDNYVFFYKLDWLSPPIVTVQKTPPMTKWEFRNLAFGVFHGPEYNVSRTGQLVRAGTAFRVGIGFGYFLALFLILPVFLWTPLLYRRIRRQPLVGFCAKCGYDLRASADRCPECGTIPKAIAAAT